VVVTVPVEKLAVKKANQFGNAQVQPLLANDERELSQAIRWVASVTTN